MSGDNKHPAANADDAQWQYKTEASSSPTQAPNYPEAVASPVEQAEVEWTASEFIAHSKGVEWYALITLAVVALAAIIFFLTRDTLSVAIVVIVGLLFGASAARSPRVLAYKISSKGIDIAHNHYSYAEFKSFSVMREGATSSIMFMPLKRFMPPINIYYDPTDEDHIVEVLAHYLPMEARAHDAMDRFISRIRF